MNPDTLEINPHGDSEAITDASGNVIYSSTYDAFGNAVTGGGLTYGYTGKFLRESDSATGYTRMEIWEIRGHHT